jgi:hypothetical protein
VKEGPDWQTAASIDGLQFRCGREGDHFVADWEGALRVRTDPTGAIMSVDPYAGVDPRYLRKLVDGAVAAFARSVAGKLSLHASAVAFKGAAVLCIGQSGSGKSTMAAQLCQRPGVELFADDVAAVESCDGTWVVLPTEAHHWLSLSDAEKEPVAAIARGCGPARVLAVVSLVLIDHGTTTLRRLHGTEAFARLFPTPMRFALTASAWRRELEELSALGTTVPIFELERARTASPAEVARLLEPLMILPREELR